MQEAGEGTALDFPFAVADDLAKSAVVREAEAVAIARHDADGGAIEITGQRLAGARGGRRANGNLCCRRLFDFFFGRTEQRQEAERRHESDRVAPTIANQQPGGAVTELLPNRAQGVVRGRATRGGTRQILDGHFLPIDDRGYPPAQILDGDEGEGRLFPVGANADHGSIAGLFVTHLLGYFQQGSGRKHGEEAFELQVCQTQFFVPGLEREIAANAMGADHAYHLSPLVDRG